MPMTDPVAGRQTGGPAPLTIIDLQCHARWVGEGGVGRCENAVFRPFLVGERCGKCKGSGVAFNTGCRPGCWCGPFAEPYVTFTEWFG